MRRKIFVVEDNEVKFVAVGGVLAGKIVRNVA